MAVDNSGVSDDFSPDLGLTKCQFGFTERLLRYPSRALIGDDRVCADRSLWLFGFTPIPCLKSLWKKLEWN